MFTGWKLIMFTMWENCLLKGGKGWLLQKHGNGYSKGELNGCMEALMVRAWVN